MHNFALWEVTHAHPSLPAQKLFSPLPADDPSSKYGFPILEAAKAITLGMFRIKPENKQLGWCVAMRWDIYTKTFVSPLKWALQLQRHQGTDELRISPSSESTEMIERSYEKKKGGGPFPIIVTLLPLDSNLILLYIWTNSDNMTTAVSPRMPGLIMHEVWFTVLRVGTCACLHEY